MFPAHPLRLAALAAVCATGLLAGPAHAQTSTTAQPAWLGTVVGAGEAKLSALGAGPAALAYAPEGGDVVLARSSGTGDKQLKVVVARQSSTTGKLAARGACLSFPASGTCATLPDAPANVTDVVITPDGKSVHLVGTGVLTLQRDPATGALTPAGACLPPAGAANCQAGGPVLSLALPAKGAADAPGFLADGTTLRLVTRDATTGALSFTPGSQTCLSDAAAVAGCTQAPGAGARGLQVTSDGRNVYAPGLTGADVTIFRASLTAPATLTAPVPVLVVPKACPSDETCFAPQALLSPDDRHLYLTNPVSSLEADYVNVPDLAYALGTDGALTPLACGKNGCTQLIGPAAISPKGDQVYGFTYGSTSGETLGATLSMVTFARNAETGVLRQKPAAFDDALLGVVESAGEGPGTVTASPDGQWLLSGDLDVFHRRTAKPPTISIKGLPKKGSCARRDAKVRITISGASRDPKRTTYADATFATSESGVTRGTRTTKAATFTLKVKRFRKGEMLVTVVAAGKRGNDVTRQVEFKFC